MPEQRDLFEYLLRLGDDRIVLGHRLSEWCGHGPILEEDIATANIALDLVGQGTLFLKAAAEVQAAGRSADDLAFFREAVEYRNLQIVELPKGDFAFTMLRQFLFDTFSVHQLDALQKSTNPEITAISTKALKEARYHIRHSSQWVIRFGDGTEESHSRVQDALNELWRFTGEMFLNTELDEHLQSEGIAPLPGSLEAPWRTVVDDVFKNATLSVPENTFMMRGGREGKHTEHLGHMLSEMQIVARSHPGAEW
ncbi:MAG: phenylacetate-CoA oxygenase subunit PaaC [Gemmatimonadaceae bacterium]|nr:phenylacetate-CoA oxygenase subunit PaaC [Gemmatimonadaceae bacterium]